LCTKEWFVVTFEEDEEKSRGYYPLIYYYVRKMKEELKWVGWGYSV